MAFPVYASGEPGLGVILQRGSSLCPETFTDVGRVGNLTGPDMSRATHKTSAHSRDPGAAHTYIPGMLEGGKLTFDLFIKTDNASDRQLAADFKAGTIIDWRLVYTVDSVSSTFDFTGFFDAFKLTHPVDGPVMAACSIKVTGTLYPFES